VQRRRIGAALVVSLAAGVAVTALATGWSRGNAASRPAAAAPTWKHVAPIFAQKCSACHGDDGYGSGMVSTRSAEIGMPINAASFHTDVVRGRPNGHIFNTITNGIRTMPAYSAQIPAEDRWAIVAYVRALELSQNAPANVAAGDGKGEPGAQASSSSAAPR